MLYFYTLRKYQKPGKFSDIFWEHKNATFPPGVTFQIETSYFICTANQMTGFYLKCSTGLKWIKCKLKRSAQMKSTTLIIRIESSLFLFLLRNILNIRLLWKHGAVTGNKSFTSKWIIKSIRHVKPNKTFLFILRSIVYLNLTTVSLIWQIINLTNIKHPTLRINPKRNRKIKYHSNANKNTLNNLPFSWNNKHNKYLCKY